MFSLISMFNSGTEYASGCPPSIEADIDENDLGAANTNIGGFLFKTNLHISYFTLKPLFVAHCHNFFGFLYCVCLCCPVLLFFNLSLICLPLF